MYGGDSLDELDDYVSLCCTLTDRPGMLMGCCRGVVGVDPVCILEEAYAGSTG